MDFNQTEINVVIWARERKIYTNYSDLAQISKLTEELSELILAINKNDVDEITDAIGDMMVVLTNICHMRCTCKMADCYNTAYESIKDRKGTMINGTFVKEVL